MLDRTLNIKLWQRTRITLEFSFSVSKTRAAHHLAVFSLPIPLLSNLVVYTIVVAPLCGGGGSGKELAVGSDAQDSDSPGTCHTRIWKEWLGRLKVIMPKTNHFLGGLDFKILSLPFYIF